MSPEQFHATLRESQRAKADLHAWGAVIDLLEGSSAPSARHHNAAAQRCIKTAQAEIQKALKRMNSADSKLIRAAAQQTQGGSTCE